MFLENSEAKAIFSPSIGSLDEDSSSLGMRVDMRSWDALLKIASPLAVSFDLVLSDDKNYNIFGFWEPNWRPAAWLCTVLVDSLMRPKSAVALLPTFFFCVYKNILQIIG